MKLQQLFGRKRHEYNKTTIGKVLLMSTAWTLVISIASPAASRAAVTTGLRGTDTSTGSSNETSKDGTVRWVTSYGHTGSLGTLVYDQQIPGNGKYVPGSFSAPPSFERLFSGNGGTSYDAADPGQATTHLRATGQAPGTATARAQGVVVPPTSFNAGNAAGDGMEVVFFDNRVYNVNHHRGVGPNALKMVQCHDKTTGQPCPGFPTYASSAAGTLGTGVDDMVTPNQNWAAVDQQRERIYVPTGRVDTTQIGVLCIDLSETTASFPGRSCGFKHLGESTLPSFSNSTNGGGRGEVSGGAQIGSRMFIIGNDSRVYCYDMSTDAVCQGWPATGFVSDPGAPATGQSPNQVAASVLQAYDDRYVFGVHSLGGTSQSLLCIDATTNSLCPGFPVNIPAGLPKVAPILDATGDNVTGICVVNNTSTTAAAWGCYDVDDASSMGVAPWQNTQPAGQVGSFGYYSTVAIGPKLYMVNSPTNSTAAYSCWDFAANADCAGFVRNTPDADVAPYSLREDPFVPGCIWMLGDIGVFEQFDADTGGIECLRTAGTVSAEPSSFYCDGQSGHVTSWSRLSIHNLAGNTEYARALITVRDRNGHALPGFDARALTGAELTSSQVDISGLPISGDTALLTAQITIIGADRAAWTSDGNDANDPYIQLSWQGDDIQFCFETTATACSPDGTLAATARLFTTDDENPNGQAATANASLRVNCGGPRLAETGSDMLFVFLAAAGGLGAGLLALDARPQKRRRVAKARS